MLKNLNNSQKLLAKGIYLERYANNVSILDLADILKFDLVFLLYLLISQR